MLQRLAVEDTEVVADDVLVRLAREAGTRVVAELEAQARQGDALTYASQIGWLKQTMEELADPATGIDATGRLVRWIVDRFEVGA